MSIDSPILLDSQDPALYEVVTRAPGPRGRLPLTADMLLHRPSGDAFGMTEDAGMGWEPLHLAGPQFVILSTLGGMRAEDGTPIALGYHTGHFELGLAIRAAAEELKRAGAVPYAAYCTDPCDGRTQGTPGMFDSLAYRNDAASVLRRQVRSIPTARGILGVAACDKGLPAMMMALVSFGGLPSVLVPGGVTLPSTDGEDTGKIQSIGARFARGELSLEDACVLGCRVCASPGGGCHFLGTAASAQVVAEALGLALPHSALAPSGQPIGRDMARRSALAVLDMAARGVTIRDVVTEASIHNAMVVHAAFGGSTNLILHLPAIAFAAGLPRPGIDDWTEVHRGVHRPGRPRGPGRRPDRQAPRRRPHPHRHRPQHAGRERGPGGRHLWGIHPRRGRRDPSRASAAPRPLARSRTPRRDPPLGRPATSQRRRLERLRGRRRPHREVAGGRSATESRCGITTEVLRAGQGFREAHLRAPTP